MVPLHLKHEINMAVATATKNKSVHRLLSPKFLTNLYILPSKTHKKKRWVITNLTLIVMMPTDTPKTANALK